MGIIIDIAIIAIILLCVIIGYMKGLTKCLLKIVSFVLALVVSFILFKPIASLVISNTELDENLEHSIKELIIHEQQTTLAEGKNDQKEKQTMPSVIMDYISKELEKAENEANEAKNNIVETAAHNVAETAINVGVLFTLFIVSRIVLLLIKGLASIITELPLIRQFDKVGGVIYGILQSLVIIYIGLAIISFISPMIPNSGLIEGMQSSHIGSTLYNNNLLLKIVF